MKKFKENDLVQTFFALTGNPKWSLMTEPLWFIPYALFTPFATLYMRKLGLSSEEIGLTISVGFALQVVFALVGGIITDKLGRRLTTLIFDFVGWSIPCLIWAFAQNFWWFMAAAAVNAVYQVTNTSWNCLFIEDCPPKYLTDAFTLGQFTGMLSVFVAPLAIYFVDQYSVVRVVSVLYFISAVSMTLKFAILYHFSTETSIGIQRKEETKHISAWVLFKGYTAVFAKVLRSSRMLFVLLFMALTNIILITTNNFFSLYITEALALEDNVVAAFPMLRTLVMLLFVWCVQNALNRFKMRNSLLLGFAFYALSHVILLVAPEGNLWFVAVYTIFEAAAYAIVIPRKDALMAFYVDVEDRSRIYSIFNAGMIALSTPFGFIVGKLFEWNTMYPFVFNIAVFAVCVYLIFRVKAIALYDAETVA